MSLQNEVKFLKDEIRSKNKIIELLIADYRSYNLIANAHSEKVIDNTKQPIENSRDIYKENDDVIQNAKK